MSAIFYLENACKSEYIINITQFDHGTTSGHGYGTSGSIIAAADKDTSQEAVRESSRRAKS